MAQVKLRPRELHELLIKLDDIFDEDPKVELRLDEAVFGLFIKKVLKIATLTVQQQKRFGDLSASDLVSIFYRILSRVDDDHLCSLVEKKPATLRKFLLASVKSPKTSLYGQFIVQLLYDCGHDWVENFLDRIGVFRVLDTISRNEKGLYSNRAVIYADSFFKKNVKSS